MGSENIVQSSVRTIEIIELLAEKDGMRITDLANYLGHPKSTIHNHLSTLRENGYVVKDDNLYKISLRFLRLGGCARNNTEIYRKGKPEVNKIARETGELANLATFEHGRGVYLYLTKGEQGVDLDTYVGMDFYMHCTALGKAMLAYFPEEKVNEILETQGMPRRTPSTVTDRDTLLEELSTIRETGYATDKAERLEGLRCVAAPIKDEDGEVLGGISVSGPTNRMKGDRFSAEIPEKVLNAANVIELNINYSD